MPTPELDYELIAKSIHSSPSRYEKKFAIDTLYDVVEKLQAQRDQFAATVAELVEQANTMRAELEQQRAELGDEWGVKWADRNRVVEYESEDIARREHAAAIDPDDFNLPSSRLLRREATPWRDADDTVPSGATHATAAPGDTPSAPETAEHDAQDSEDANASSRPPQTPLATGGTITAEQAAAIGRDLLDGCTFPAIPTVAPGTCPTHGDIGCGDPDCNSGTERPT